MLNRCGLSLFPVRLPGENEQLVPWDAAEAKGVISKGRTNTHGHGSKDWWPKKISHDARMLEKRRLAMKIHLS